MSRFAPVLILLSAFLLAVFTVVGNHGLLHLKKINNELTVLEDKNRKLKSDISEMETKIVSLERSSFELEKRAREELGLSRAGEIVYIVPEADKPRQ